MNKPVRNITLTIFKIIGWILLVILVLAGIVRLILYTGAANNFIKQKALSIANEQLNGRLDIQKLEGDLWRGFTANEMTVSRYDTLLHLDTLQIRYHILSLLGNEFQVDLVKASGLFADIEEQQDGAFNIQQLIKSDSTTADTSSGAFGVNIRELKLNNGKINVYAPSFLPDSSLRIQSLQTSASLKTGEDFSVQIESLQFRLLEGMLPNPVNISASAGFKNNIITLNHLLANTGKSLLSAYANVNIEDSTIQANADAQPLDLSDIQAFLDNDLPDAELAMAIQVSGDFNSIEAKVEASSKAFSSLAIQVRGNLSGEPRMDYLKINASDVDISQIQPQQNISIANLTAELKGRVSQDYENAVTEFNFDLSGLRYQDYKLALLSGRGELNDGKLSSTIHLKEGQSQILLKPEIQNLFTEERNWKLRAVVHELNPGNYMSGSAVQGSVSLLLTANGKHFELSNQPWSFTVHTLPEDKPLMDILNSDDPVTQNDQHKEILIAGKTISELQITGLIDEDALAVDGLIQQTENIIKFDAELSGLQTETKNFSYSLLSDNFDIAEILTTDSLSAQFDFYLEGNGQLQQNQEIFMEGIAEIDSGFVNGAPVERIQFDYAFNDNLIYITNGQMVSEIADASFSGEKRAEAAITTEDFLEFELQIKNMQPLAGFVQAQVLQATGNINGSLRENKEGLPEYSGNVELREIRFNDSFQADEVSGNCHLIFQHGIAYDLNLTISAPTISGITLQDLYIETPGSQFSDSLSGNMNINIHSKDAGDIFQSLNYKVQLDDLAAELLWHSLIFDTPGRRLTLQKPFELTYRNYQLQTDTLWLSSESETYLNLAVPVLDSLNQFVWIDGYNFNFGVIQEIIFGERYIDGILSGEVTAERNHEVLRANGSVQVRELNYKNADIDSVWLQFDLADKRLKAEGSMSLEGEEKVSGNLDVPFILGNPEDFEDEFFEEPVFGKIDIYPVQLERFDQILTEMGMTETTGILSFSGQLEGSAGQPNFSGHLALGNPVLSGIPVDTAFAHFNYNHLAKHITTKAEIHARGQKAASVDTKLPISVNFRTFEIITPDERDTIQIDVLTENFNISVFNDFLDKQYFSGLRGMLNADIKILGTVGNLNPEGSLVLNGARVNLPMANIVLDKIRADVNFKPDGLELQQLVMRSGGGTFNLSGDIQTQGIKPVGMNLQANARQFRLINTDYYNMTIDLESELTGTPTKPAVSGDLTIRNGFVYLQDFGEGSVENVQLEEEEESSLNIYDSLSLDMNLAIARNFFIRNNRYLDLEVELTGELDAQKSSGSDLELFGSLNARDGYARPLGKLFELEDGEFTFSGPIENPNIFLRTSYVPQTAQSEGDPILLYYIIEGTAQEPVFRFESEPQMEQQDIIAYTLFGRPFYALDSWQQVMSGGGSSPANLLVDVLLDEFEALATRELGIDVVQINNTRSGFTSVKTGWYLNRRTFFSIINEISSDPKTLFILEYMLKENLDLIITQGDDNRQGIDIRWEYEY